VEIDNFYLKEGLGIADFRSQSLEVTDKWFAVILVSLSYLQYSRLKATSKLTSCPAWLISSANIARPIWRTSSAGSQKKPCKRAM
jgi:hypothetical protein